MCPIRTGRLSSLVPTLVRDGVRLVGCFAFHLAGGDSFVDSDEEQRARFRSAVQELLESKPDDGTMEPDKKRIVTEFWRLPMQFRRSKLSVNRVAQCLRGDAKDANMDMGHEQRSGRMSDF